MLISFGEPSLQINLKRNHAAMQHAKKSQMYGGFLGSDSIADIDSLIVSDLKAVLFGSKQLVLLFAHAAGSKVTAVDKSAQ